jgi:hypothetical protein
MPDFNDDDLQELIDMPIEKFEVKRLPAMPKFPLKKPERQCTAQDQLAGGLCGNCLKRH